MWDNHMHSIFSDDCEFSPSEMIASAKSKKLEGITFTDHLDLDYKEPVGMFNLNVPDYYKKQHELALSESTKDFTVLTGIEVGLMTSTAARNNDLVKSQPFDFVIGSTHVVDGKDPYYPVFWENKDTTTLLRRYYEVILENIKTYSHYDSLGHLDYGFRYAPIAKNSDSYTLYKEIVDAILETIIKQDKALEINTGALYKGFDEPNPRINIIKRYKELGGKLITIGADSHTPENIAFGFEKLPELLKNCGFDEYAVYKKRIPQLYKL